MVMEYEHPYRVPFLNTAFDNVDKAQVRQIISHHIREKKPGYMVSLNTDIDITLEQDQSFREAHSDASLVLMDSQPLFNIAKWKGIPIKEKIAGSDLMDPVCDWAAEEGWSIFILGGGKGVPERACENLQARHHGLVVAGSLSPEYGFEKDPVLLAQTLATVAAASPDILFVCLGAPKSERLVHDHLIEMNAMFSLCIGAAVDFAAGTVKRAPRWVSDHSLEWFYRFLQEPKRLFKRYFVDSWKILRIVKKYWKVSGEK